MAASDRYEEDKRSKVKVKYIKYNLRLKFRPAQDLHADIASTMM
jgi:hypothetical protein